MKDRNLEAPDFRTYSLENNSGRYKDEVAGTIAKWASRLQLQMKTSSFSQFHTVSIIASFYSFKLACDMNGLHERAVMWLLHFFMKKLAAAALNSTVALRVNCRANSRKREPSKPIVKSRAICWKHMPTLTWSLIQMQKWWNSCSPGTRCRFSAWNSFGTRSCT